MKIRDYQNEAVTSVFHYFEKESGNPLIAMPTATGKGYVIAELSRLIFQYFPYSRIMILTHVRELIEQNVKKLQQVWPTAPFGIYSAGLKQRDHMQPIIFGGVASVNKCVELFGWRDLLIIDEAHLLSPDEDTMYQQIIAKLKLVNPRLKVIGLTATWFRMGQGLLTNSGLFTDICYNLCDAAGFQRMISGEYLCTPIPKITKTELDVSNVGLDQKGEFAAGQLQRAVDKRDINTAILNEICEHGYTSRKSWLIFCSGIEHAEHCAAILDSWGIPAAAVHSKIASGKRDQIIADFKAGKLRAVTNNNVLTTGFDYEAIDLIGMLRPTMSPGLWVQMIGRGTRPAPGKNDCLVLDFARNTMRLGPIDDPQIPRPKSEGTGEVPVKLCDYCGAYNHLRVKFCICCGAEFTFEEKKVRQADTRPLLSNNMPVVERFAVDRVMYNRHVGREKGTISIRVSYMCGLRMFNEFICFDASSVKSFAIHHAHQWWAQAHPGPPPLSTDMALARLHELRTPRYIRVWVNKKFPEVKAHEY